MSLNRKIFAIIYAGRESTGFLVLTDDEGRSRILIDSSIEALQPFFADADKFCRLKNHSWQLAEFTFNRIVPKIGGAP